MKIVCKILQGPKSASELIMVVIDLFTLQHATIVIIPEIFSEQLVSIIIELGEERCSAGGTRSQVVCQVECPQIANFVS